MKNLKMAYGVITILGLGFLFGQFIAKGTINKTIGVLIGLLILPALLDLKFIKK